MNRTDLECIFNKQITFDQKSCSLECPLECDSVGYELQISTLQFPDRRMFELIHNDVGIQMNLAAYGFDLSSFEALKEQFASINVFYQYTQYTDIVLTPKTSVYDIISNVGGLLGIFLGFSIFSLIELLEFLVRAALILLGKS